MFYERSCIPRAREPDAIGGGAATSAVPAGVGRAGVEVDLAERSPANAERVRGRFLLVMGLIPNIVNRES